MKKEKKKLATRGHPDLNQGPLDLQSNALPLSYTPFSMMCGAFYIDLLFTPNALQPLN